MTAARYDWRRGAKVALLAQLLVLIMIAAGYASALYVHIPMPVRNVLLFIRPAGARIAPSSGPA